MRWLRCECKGADLLGTREGHCAACFHVRKSGTTSECTEVVLVIGGYCDGELSSTPIVAELHTLPTLRWMNAQVDCHHTSSRSFTESNQYESSSNEAMQIEWEKEQEEEEEEKCKRVNWREMWNASDIFTVDGATLTSMGDNCALLFGGLNELCERRNNTFYVTMTSTHTFTECKHSCMMPSSERSKTVQHRLQEEILEQELQYIVHVQEVETYGDIPPARSRHSAASLLTSETLVIFGGETDELDQSNEMYTLTLHTRLWRRIEHSCCSCAPDNHFISCSTGSNEVLSPSEERCSLSNTAETDTNEKTQSSISCINWPAARFNSSSSLAVVHDKFIVLYGGAHFVNGCMSSLNDVWLFDLRTYTWHAVPIASSLRNSECSVHSFEWPSCNGHVGTMLHCVNTRVSGNTHYNDHNYENKHSTINDSVQSTVFFLGGKDVITGCNSVKCMEVSVTGECALSLKQPLVLNANNAKFVKVDTCAWCHDMWRRVENNNNNSTSNKGETELLPEVGVAEEEIDMNNVGWPVWRYCSAVVTTAHNDLLLLAGQCRHPQPTSSYVLRLDDDE